MSNKRNGGKIMKKIVGILASCILIFGSILTGCSKSNSDDNFKEQIIFTGSSTLAPVITNQANSFKEKNKTWDNVNKDFPKKDISIFVNSGGSGAGIKAVIDGTSDIGMVSRTVSDEEKGKIEGYQELKLGVDALTVSVNPENEILKKTDNLTTEVIRKIFSGEYKYWDDADTTLPHDEIVVVIRDIGGGAHKVFKSKVMGDVDVRKDAIQSPSMGALVTKVIENKNAIGYASFGLVNQNEGKIVPLKVDDSAPTKENIISGAYKISRPLLIIKKGEFASQEKAFVDLLLSEEGQKTVEELGFVPAK